jgi:hypothetical protein
VVKNKTKENKIKYKLKFIYFCCCFLERVFTGVFFFCGTSFGCLRQQQSFTKQIGTSSEVEGAVFTFGRFGGSLFDLLYSLTTVFAARETTAPTGAREMRTFL